MRVLAVGSLYPPHHRGGYELAWQGAMEELRARGHVVRVLASGTRFQAQAEAPEGRDVHRELRWYWREDRFPRLGFRARVALERHNHAVLARHLRDFAPDVVSWWAMGGMSLSLLEAVRRRGLAAVGFVHDDWLIYGPQVDGWLRPFARRPRLAAIAERATGLPARVDFPRAARWVFVSESVRASTLATAGLDGEIASSGIDPAFLAADGGARVWEGRLLYVGRVDPRKGIATAVEALARLPAAASLTVVGDGDARELAGLRALIRARGLEDRVRFAGQRTRAELPAIYAAHDAVLFPVVWEEPWGLVPLEGMAAGRPVLATGRGGSGEYLRDGENCLLFAPGDPAALAAAVERVAGDAELRAALRAGGRRTAEAHTDGPFHVAVEAALAAGAQSAASPGGASPGGSEPGGPK